VLVFGESSSARQEARRAVYGVAVNDKSEVSVVVTRVGSVFYYELPGGGLIGEEGDVAGLSREFLEETAMRVTPTHWISQAGQFYCRSDGASYRFNFGGFWLVKVEAYEPEQQSPDHKLVWMDPLTAITNLERDSHRWFVTNLLTWPRRDRSAHYRSALADFESGNRPPVEFSPELVG
jgi:8-oxo-dGTP diphosphatase